MCCRRMWRKVPVTACVQTWSMAKFMRPPTGSCQQLVSVSPVPDGAIPNSFALSFTPTTGSFPHPPERYNIGRRGRGRGGAMFEQTTGCDWVLWASHVGCQQRTLQGEAGTTRFLPHTGVSRELWSRVQQLVLSPSILSYNFFLNLQPLINKKLGPVTSPQDHLAPVSAPCLNTSVLSQCFWANSTLVLDHLLDTGP